MLMADFWPLKGSQRILGMPDASYRNNSDKSSQRAHVIFLAEDRKLPSKGTYRNSGYDKQAYRLNGSESATRGSIIDYESHKITTTTQSTTVAELNALMKCFGTCLFLRPTLAAKSFRFTLGRTRIIESQLLRPHIYLNKRRPII